MLSSNSETESAAAPFPAPADLFLPENPTAKQKIRFPKPIFSAEMLANPPIMLTLRKCKLRKLPHGVGTESQGWKASLRRGHGIPKLESFPTAWARNPKAGKLPHGVGTESRSWKVSPQRGRGIPRLESFPTAWARNPKAGKLPHSVGMESRQSTVGAGFACPNAPTNTYVDVFGRANPAPTR